MRWRSSSRRAPARTRNLALQSPDSGSTRSRVSADVQLHIGNDESSFVVALRGKEIDAFLARPDPGRPIILLYGPDAGLVRERADALLASAVDDPNDPFSLVKLDGDELSAEPSRLVDQAITVPLFPRPPPRPPPARS